MKQKPVVFLTRKFPPAAGGMETFSAKFTAAFSGPKKVISYSTQPKDIWWVAPVLLLRGLFAGRNASLFHLGDLVLAPIGAILHILTGKPIVATAHALELTHANPHLRRLIDWALPRIDHIVAVSQFTAGLLEERGVPKERISVITHGVVEPTPLSAEEARQQIARATQIEAVDHNNRLILTTIGRLVPRKGVAWFIEHVMPQIMHLNPLYLVVSDGPDRARIEQVITEKKMESSVRLLGRVDDTLLTALYHGSDLFVVPNIHVAGDAEGFGFVAIEAAVSGLPVIAANIDGIPDAIHHEKNGLLVTAGDATAYTEVITYWAHYPVQRKTFGRSAREYTLAHFNWEQVAQQYLELFDTITARYVDRKTRV